MTDTKGFFLPDPVDGYPIKTICLEIPDAPEYIRAFWGHFQMLGKWWLWEHTKHSSDTRAKEAAEYWRPIILENMQRFYSGEVCDMPFDVRQNTLSPCTLEKSTDDGETWIAWANLRLCAPRLRRFNPVTGVYEESLDDGETWTEAPNPLNQGNFRNPPLTGIDAKCDAAYNAQEYLAGLVDSIRSGVDATSALASIAGVVAGAIGLVTGGATLPGAFLLEGIAAVFYAGSTAIGLAFDSAFYDDLRCIFYCQSDDNGQFDATQWQAVIDALNEIGGLAGTFTAIAIQVSGADGLSNMGTVGEGGGECLDCDCDGEWCMTFDFTAGANGWEQEGTYTATLYTGEGWGAVDDLGNGNVNYSARHAGIKIAFGSSAYVTSMHVELTTGNAQNFWYYVTGGSFASPIAIIANPQGIPIDDTTDSIALLVDRPNPDSMTSRIMTVTLRGTGANPFGEDNC